MANRRDKKDVDAELDLHGHTVADMRLVLQQRWSEWRGLRRVRIIHGRGEVLKPEVERWCQEMGIPFAIDQGNPGATRIFPSLRTIPDNTVGVTLREKGLRLTPEQESYLRNPQAVERARQEELRRKREEEAWLRADEAARAARKREEEALWQIEMARLTKLDKNRPAGIETNAKPRPPVILPPTEIKYQEGYWRAELVRVADTDTDTLKKQKRTGLDKLASPMEARAEAKAVANTESARVVPPQRDTKEDQALFEAEMARLEEWL